MGEGGVYELLIVADVGGGGVKIWQKSADVINGRPQKANYKNHLHYEIGKLNLSCFDIMYHLNCCL